MSFHAFVASLSDAQRAELQRALDAESEPTVVRAGRKYVAEEAAGRWTPPRGWRTVQEPTPSELVDAEEGAWRPLDGVQRHNARVADGRAAELVAIREARIQDGTVINPSEVA